MEAGVTPIPLIKWLFILVSLLVLASFIVLIFWAPDFRKKGGHRGFIIAGTVLHLAFLLLIALLYAAPRIIGDTDEIRKIIFPIAHFLFDKAPFLVLITKFALIIFQAWMGFDLFLEKQYPLGKRFLGAIPVLAVFFNGMVLGLLILIVMGAIMFTYHFFVKRAESPGNKTAPAGTGKQQGPGMVFEAGPPSPVKQEPKVKPVPSCKAAALTVQADHISTLKSRGGEFSAALNGKIIHLQDRLLFENILVAVTRVEPQGPVKITNETNISIHGSEEPVILHCLHCGEIQQQIQNKCSACGSKLPVHVF